jgi:glycine cleavage system H lipoate-binding protein
MHHAQPKYSEPVRRIWPEGESACIWMQAGLVAFKLCDRAFECETCPFDSLMRGSATNESLSPGPHPSAGRGGVFRQLPDPRRGEDSAFYFYPDAWYGTGFWYLRNRGENLIEIGLNEIGSHFLPPVREVIMPRPGTLLSSTQTAMWLIASEGTMGLTSPCAGVVVRANPQLLESLIQKQEKAQQVWFLEIEVSSLHSAHKGLRKGAKAAEYLQTQHREILHTLENALEPLRKELGPTSPDGGSRLASIAEMLGASRYFHLIAPFFRK